MMAATMPAARLKAVACGGACTHALRWQEAGSSRAAACRGSVLAFLGGEGL